MSMSTKNVWFVMFIIISIVILGCKEPALKSESHDKISDISFMLDSTKIQYGNGCQLPDSLIHQCLVINEFTLNVSGRDAIITSAINDTLAHYFKKTLANIAFYNDDSVNFSNNELTKNELIAKIQTMHQAQIKEMPDAPSVWNIDTYADTICVLPKIISIQYSEFTFLGGAHPNTFSTFLNFDRRSGKTIPLNDLVKDKKKFLLLAEEGFRKNQELSSDQNLEEAGYFFEKGKFALANNFSIKRDGIELYYNTYEAAAYVFGPLTFTLSYEQLKDCVYFDLIK